MTPPSSAMISRRASPDTSSHGRPIANKDPTRETASTMALSAPVASS